MVHGTTTANQLSSLKTSGNKNTQTINNVNVKNNIKPLETKCKNFKFDPTLGTYIKDAGVRVVNLIDDKSHTTTPAIYEIKNLVWNKNPDLHHSPASKEWINSIYSYNRNYVKSLPIISNITNKLLTSYFNLSYLVNGKKSNVNLVLEKRMTLNQIFVSKAEIKHINDKINLTVHIYNRKKKTIAKRLNLLSKGLISLYDTFKRKTNLYVVSCNALAPASKMKPAHTNTHLFNVFFSKKNVTKNVKKSAGGSICVMNNKCDMVKLSDYYTKDKTFTINGKNNKDVNNINKSYLHDLKALTETNFRERKIKKTNFNAISQIFNGFFIKKKAGAGAKIKFVDIRLSKLLKWGVRHLKKIRKLKAELLDIISSPLWSKKSRDNNQGYAVKLENGEGKYLTSLNQSFTKYELKFFSKYLDKAYYKEMLYIYYIRALLLNNNLFKNWFLLGLKKTLSVLYNKKVELNIVNQKYFHMNSDIFIKAIQTRLKNRNNPFLSEINYALRSVSLPKFNNTFSLKKNNANTNTTKLCLSRVVNKEINNNFLFKPEVTKHSLKKNIFNSIKYKHIHGVRIEAAGRLTKRLTASRALFKIRNKGTLKNYDVTFANKGALMLRGYIRPNLQYTNISAKTRNGAFGLKGWVNSS